MTIREVAMYKVICDGCGEEAEEGTDYYAWADAQQAEDQAINGAEWIGRGGKHYCDDCIVFDEERDEYVPKPETAQNRAQDSHTPTSKPPDVSPGTGSTP